MFYPLFMVVLGAGFSVSYMVLWAQSTAKDYIRLKTNFSLSPSWKQTSIYLLDIYFTSHDTVSLFLKPQLSVKYLIKKPTQHYTLLSERKSRKQTKKQQQRNNNMFWSQFISHGHWTRKPVSVVCSHQQSDLFYYAGPHRNRWWPKPTKEKFGWGLAKCRWMDRENRN